MAIPTLLMFAGALQGDHFMCLIITAWVVQLLITLLSRVLILISPLRPPHYYRPLQWPFGYGIIMNCRSSVLTSLLLCPHTGYLRAPGRCPPMLLPSTHCWCCHASCSQAGTWVPGQGTCKGSTCVSPASIRGGFGASGGLVRSMGSSGGNLLAL